MFRVHSKTGRKFRRNGITFDTSPATVEPDKLGWTEEQNKALRETPALHVEEMGGPPPPAAEPSTMRAESADTPESSRRRGR
jgi:hypothetical protein